MKQTHLRFATDVDGKSVGGNRCRPGANGRRWGVRVNPSTRKRFTFANLQTTGMCFSGMEVCPRADELCQLLYLAPSPTVSGLVVMPLVCDVLSRTLLR